MKITQSQPDPIRTYKRKQAGLRRVGANNRCSCGETRPEALVGSTGLCAACGRKRRGHSVTDQHHPAGCANSPVTVAIPVNDHRATLSVAQFDWPKKTLENPEGCPLRAGAACIRGFIETLLYLCEQSLTWIIGLLETLSDYLIERLGTQWWAGTPIEQFGRKG